MLCAVWYYFTCQSYVICMYSFVARISFVSLSYVLVFQRYAIRMLSACLSYVVVCHPYLTRIYLYVIRMSLVSTRTSPVCHSPVVLPWAFLKKVTGTCFLITKLFHSTIIQFFLNKAYHLHKRNEHLLS